MAKGVTAFLSDGKVLHHNPNPEHGAALSKAGTAPSNSSACVSHKGTIDIYTVENTLSDIGVANINEQHQYGTHRQMNTKPFPSAIHSIR